MKVETNIVMIGSPFSSQANSCYFLIVGNNQQVPLRNETENCETLKKQINLKPSTEKKINKGPKEETLCCAKEEITTSEVCIAVFLLFRFKIISLLLICMYRYVCMYMWGLLCTVTGRHV